MSVKVTDEIFESTLKGVELLLSATLTLRQAEFLVRLLTEHLRLATKKLVRMKSRSRDY